MQVKGEARKVISECNEKMGDARGFRIKREVYMGEKNRG